MADSNQISAKEEQVEQNGDEINPVTLYKQNDSQLNQQQQSPQQKDSQDDKKKQPNGSTKKRPLSNTKRRSISKQQVRDHLSPTNDHDNLLSESESRLSNISESNQLQGKQTASQSPQKKRGSSMSRQKNVGQTEEIRGSEFSKKEFIGNKYLQDNQEMENILNQKLRKNDEKSNKEQTSNQDFLQMRIDKAEKNRQDLAKLMEPQQILEFFQKHKVHSKEILNLEELNQSIFLRLKRYKQCLYYGEVQNHSRTGKGVMIYFSGRLYEGDWQNDSKFGRGFELYPNGNAYEGYFVNGKPEGFGTYIWYNGEIYDGEWVNGMKHGCGQWMGVKGDSYTGEWKFGKADGTGIHKWINGDTYEGEFKACLKHGKGQESFSNGDLYIGQYANGRPEGYGEYFWKDGAYYKGSFKNGLRHGQGTWKKKKDAKITDTYEGEYVNDKRCGYGVFTWASGNQYKGEYFEDLRHGYGEMYWTDSSYYKGEWERGIQCGEGELFIPGEGVKKGTFMNNIFKIHGATNGQSQIRSFKTISEENYTPRGIYQGSNTKKSFMPHTPVLTEESRTVPVGSQTNLGNSPPSITDFSDKKLPNIKSHNNSFDVQSMRSHSSQKNKGNQTVDYNYLSAYDLGQDQDMQQNMNGMNDHKRSASVQQRRQNESKGTQTRNIKDGSSDRVRLRRGDSSSKYTHLPPLNDTSSNSQKRSPPKKQKEILLKKHELIRWKGMRPKLNLKPKELRNYSDQKTVDIIRNYLHPQIWLPSGVAYCINSSSPPRSPSPTTSFHQQSIQKRQSFHQL